MAKTVLINFTRPTMYRCGELRIIGGMNEVRQEIWDAVKNNPGVKKRLAAKEIIVIGQEQKAVEIENASASTVSVSVEEETAKSLSDVNVAKAKELIRNTQDYNLLMHWKAVETRKVVIAEIDKQLKRIG